MTTILPTHPLVGYARVSTIGQSEEGALAVQISKMNDFAVACNVPILSIYRECASATRSNNCVGRNELIAAILYCQEASKRGQIIGLLVNDLTRLDRDPQSRVLGWLMGISVYSVADGGLVHPDVVRARIQDGARVAANIQEGTLQGLKRVKSSGKRLGSPGDPRVGAAASARTRREKSEQAVLRVRGYIRTHPDSQYLPVSRFADALNSAHIFNSCGRPWNETNVREKRREALRSLASVTAHSVLSDCELEDLREAIASRNGCETSHTASPT